MTEKQIETAVNEMLAPYEDNLDRHALSKLLDCTYQHLPVKLKELGIPQLESAGKWTKLVVAKPIMKQFLIGRYMSQFVPETKPVVSNEAQEASASFGN